MSQEFKSFEDFYPFYLGEHSRPATRILHFIGTGLFIGLCLMSFREHNISYFMMGPVLAYGCAWVSHFFIEKNRPATFKYPLYSLLGDFKMFAELLFFKRRFFEK